MLVFCTTPNVHWHRSLFNTIYIYQQSLEAALYALEGPMTLISANYNIPSTIRYDRIGDFVHSLRYSIKMPLYAHVMTVTRRL